MEYDTCTICGKESRNELITSYYLRNNWTKLCNYCHVNLCKFWNEEGHLQIGKKEEIIL